MTGHGIDLDSSSIRDFCKRWKIKELSIFGSILRDDFRPDSDVDFLAKFEECPEVAEYDLFDEIHMRDELSAIVGRQVDLVDRSVIEASPNPFVRAELLTTAQPVYAKR